MDMRHTFVMIFRHYGCYRYGKKPQWIAGAAYRMAFPQHTDGTLIDLEHAGMAVSSKRTAGRFVSGLAMYFSLLGAFLTSACVAAPLPSWVSSPPQDSLVALYGIGEGPSLNESTQQALRSIAGKLSTRIRSDAVSQGGISGGTATRSYQETVEAYIQDIKLSAYNVRQTELVGGRYFSLVEMSREDFVRDTQLQLDNLEADLKRKLDWQTVARPFERFLACQNISPLIEQGRLLTLALSTAALEFDASTPLRRFDAYQNQCDQVLQGVTVRLQAEPEFAPLAEALGRELAVRTVSRGRADGRLELSAKVTNREMFGSKNAVIDLSIALLDDRNSAIARQSYRLNGVSMIGYEAALDDALRKFLAADGVERVLRDLSLR
ncbi:LPP20 family lipoprotein [Pseudomonas sp.]|uniref:LPP20 family lipoprotein n=1 Tax=Pseudomonas sp. TaxID=306 RepID=UPI0019DCC2C4|nr:LPP20 family lipoprotein [Pseudomonas sp.]MBF0676614.1 LPP20 family lipoprotein [Pseudomonas sp.]